MHNPLYVFTLETEYVPDQEDVFELAHVHNDADYVTNAPEETVFHRKNLADSLRVLFPHTVVDGKTVTVTKEDIDGYLSGIISQIREMTKTLTVENFSRWRDDLRYRVLEDDLPFILDGTYRFAPTFASSLYAFLEQNGRDTVTLTLSDVYDIHY